MANHIWLIGSFNPDDPLKVGEELKSIANLVVKSKVEVIPSYSATNTDLFDTLTCRGSDILLMHFAGHAGSEFVEMNNDFTVGMSQSYMEELSEVIHKKAPSLRLAFLNGCSTKKQSEYLRQQGIPAVISTTLPLDDMYAIQFATRFYTYFLTNKQSLSEAFWMTLKEYKSSSNLRLFTGDESLLNFDHLHKDVRETAREEISQKKRGPFMLMAESSAEIFELQGDPDVLNQRFSDWQTGSVAPSGRMADPGKNEPENQGPSREHCYLLCDRGPQAEAFSELLQKKAAGALPDPNFIFVSGHNSNGIVELLQRVERYILPVICKDSRVDKLKFPNPDFFDLQHDLEKPFVQLKEIYEKELINKPGQKLGDDTLHLICHLVFNPFWKEGLEPLFQSYIGKYGGELADKIGSKVVVLFFLVHTDQAGQEQILENFSKLYQQMKHCFPDRVQYFDKLPLIEEGDLLEWHYEVFEEPLDTDEYPIEKPAMPFKDAKNYMKRIIDEAPTHA